MAEIVFYVDHEAGHIIPTFKLANSLVKSGFSVCYVGLSSCGREIIEREGFIFYELYEGFDVDLLSKYLEHYGRLLNDEVNNRIDQLNPELIIANNFLVLDTLFFHYKYKNVKQVVLYTHLPKPPNPRTLKETGLKNLSELTAGPLTAMIDFLSKNKISFQGLDDIISPLESIPEFVLCVKEFEIEEVVMKDKKRKYLGPGILEEHTKTSFFEEHNIPKNKKIIYASMGSQAKEYPEKAKHFFNLMISCMQCTAMEEFYLVMTVGSDLETWELNEPSNNVSIHSWVPQKAILERSDLAIIHGGLNTIKEAIFYETPMIVVPMGRDQRDNANRVVHHKIGIKDIVDTMSVESLSKNIIKVMTSAAIQYNIKDMGHLFKTQNQKDTGVQLIEEYLNPTLV